MCCIILADHLKTQPILSETMMPSPHPSTSSLRPLNPIFVVFLLCSDSPSTVCLCASFMRLSLSVFGEFQVPPIELEYELQHFESFSVDCVDTNILETMPRKTEEKKIVLVRVDSALLCKHTCFAYRSHGSWKRSAWKCTFLKPGLRVEKSKNAALAFSCGRWIHILGRTPLPSPSPSSHPLTTSLRPVNTAVSHNNNNNNGGLHACVGVSCNLLAL